jgi:hypothetical protein
VFAYLRAILYDFRFLFILIALPIISMAHRRESPNYPTFTTAILAQEHQIVLSRRGRGMMFPNTAFHPVLMVPLAPVRENIVFLCQTLIQHIQVPINNNAAAAPATPLAPGAIVC